MNRKDVTFQTYLDRRRGFVAQMRRWTDALGCEIGAVISGGGNGLEHRVKRANIEKWWMDIQQEDASPDLMYDLRKALSDFIEMKFIQGLPFLKVPGEEFREDLTGRTREIAACGASNIDLEHLEWALHDMQEAVGPSYRLMYRRETLLKGSGMEWWIVRMSREIFDKTPTDGWTVLDDEWMEGFWENRGKRKA